MADGMEKYDRTGTGRDSEDCVTDVADWYVRRSRRRDGRGELDEEEVAAYQTLYTCLVTVAKLLAPFAPFVAEAVYRNLVCSVDKKAPESVHLTDWPEAEADLVDKALMDETRLVMRVVSLGRAARQKSQMKVRQPLASATAFVQTTAQKAPLAQLAAQVTEEFRNKMESLRPLTLPGDEKPGQKGDVKTKRSWPRVGPDENISEAEPVKSGTEPPTAPAALVLEDL